MQEENERELRKTDVKDEIKALNRTMETLDSDEVVKQRLIQFKVMQLQEEMDDLENEKMDEQKFWGLLMGDEDDEFDYGRDIVKEESLDKVLFLPYQILPLFLEADWFNTYAEKEHVQVGGILRSGVLSGATMKAKILMEK